MSYHVETTLCHDIRYIVAALQECFFLLIVGRAIKAEITEPQQQSDLPLGGLEVLCMLILEHH